MRFSVTHVTEYRYAAPVAFAPHLLRLTPRPDSGTVLSAALLIEPHPTLRWAEPDRFGNIETRADFAGASDLLRFESRFELETAAPPPPSADAPPLPWRVLPAADLAAYLPSELVDESVRGFAEALAAEAGWIAPVFLTRLSETLYARTDRRIRQEGYAQTPSETLASATGACRDLTVLFIACCRALGVPARFVSGYQAHAESVDGQRHLHAWPEAWLPGAGWRGYDPTHGLPVTEDHVALAGGPNQAATMPIEGGYYGAAVASTLGYAISIETAP